MKTADINMLIENTKNNSLGKVETGLNDLRLRFKAETILSTLGSLKNLKVLVIGDCILDEYVFCDLMERAKKEPVLVFKHVNTELYPGGSLAIANHIANFAGEVTIITSMGGDKKADIFLDRRIIHKIFTDKNNVTLIKKRYVYRYRNTKVFEVYSHGGYEIDNELEKEISTYIDNNIDNFDVVIVADFGHGFITNGIKESILKSKKFLAINAQTNSGNLGYNYITRYKNFDFATLTEEELRLPLQDSKSSIDELVKQMGNLLNCKKICVTLGKKGIVYYQDRIYQLPVFSTRVVDTVGAGDAILAIISLLAYKKVDPEIIPFIGNCVGALAVRTMGNKEPINPIDLNRFIVNLLS